MTRIVFGETAPPGKDWWYKPALAQEHSETSREAAAKIEPTRGTLRWMVFDYITKSGGATDEEIQLALSMNPSTERPRRVELVEASMVWDSGKTRTTRSGRRAVVWVAA